MNKKKIIFLIALWILVFVMIIIAFLAWSWSNNWNAKKSKWDFTIWVVWDDKTKFSDFVNQFKKDLWLNFTPVVESFPDYDTYTQALASAIIKDQAPDVFVLNNNEKSFLLDNVSWIDPKLIDPDNFRNNYRWFFANDLIETYWEWDQAEEFLVWVPVWYETLWVFYNNKFQIYSKDLDSWSSLIAKISELTEKRSVIPLWVWDWSTVEYASDVATQFLMLENVDSIWKISKADLESTLWFYYFGDLSRSETVTPYISKSLRYKWTTKNNVDLFAKGEVAMIIGYPRMLLEINDKWEDRVTFVGAKPFPENYAGWWKSLVNYNYFAVNKDSINKDLAFSFLSYLTTNSGINNYLETFPYYLPANIVFESENDSLNKKIINSYNIKLEDFLNSDLELSSFNKWIKWVYDREMTRVLDDNVNYIDSFLTFQDYLTCLADKVINLNNLSDSCK